MTSAGEIEKRFRNNPILVKETRSCEIRRVEIFFVVVSLTEVKYLCVCNACTRVYAYKAPDGSGFGDMQFATDYNNGITYVMNVLSMWSSRVHKRVTRGQLCTIVYVQQQRDLAILYGMMLAI